MPPSLSQIAATCQVSIATVSRALSGHPYVDDALRERILKETRRVGYKQNLLVGSLMAHVRRTRTQRFVGNLALVHIATANQPTPGPQEKAILDSAKVRANELGFSAEQFDLKPDARSEAALARMLQARGITGVLFAYPKMQATPQEFPWDEFSALALDFQSREPRLNTVCHDHFASMTMALTRLSQGGYRRIGLFIESPKDERTNYKWSASFRSYQLQGGNIGRIPVLFAESMNEAAFAEWFIKYQPDLVLGHFDECLGWMQALKRKAKPADLFTLNCLGRSIPCAGIDPQLELQGRVAADTLISQLQHGERGLPASPRLISVPGKFTDGPTIRLTKPE